MKEKITNIDAYMEQNYPFATLEQKAHLEIPRYLQNEFSEERNNCSLVCITRILEYHLGWNRKDIYEDVKHFALQFGFRPDYGTFPTKIDNIAKAFYEKYRLKGTCRGIYMGNFYRPLQSEIDCNRPLMMNIGWGYYRDHSLTVSGYQIYEWKGMKIKMIEVVDGWSCDSRYLDYTQLNGIYALPIFSFNTFEVIGR